MAAAAGYIALQLPSFDHHLSNKVQLMRETSRKAKLSMARQNTAKSLHAEKQQTGAYPQRPNSYDGAALDPYRWLSDSCNTAVLTLLRWQMEIGCPQ